MSSWPGLLSFTINFRIRFVLYPQARIYLFSETGIEKIDYEETEHYQVTRNFLGNYKRRLHLLFQDEAEEGES